MARMESSFIPVWIFLAFFVGGVFPFLGWNIPQDTTNCDTTCDPGNKPCKEAVAICKTCAQDKNCKSVTDLMVESGFLQQQEAPNIPGRRKRDVDFDEYYIYHQDEYTKRPGYNDKNRKCCLTSKRAIPFTTKCPGKQHCYPVYCENTDLLPQGHGYQFRDEVNCKIDGTNCFKPLYNLKYMSMPNQPTCIQSKNRGVCGRRCRRRRRCRGKKCRGKRVATPIKSCGMVNSVRTYMVTNVPPHRTFGHCFYEKLPLWFENIRSTNHCESLPWKQK